MPVPTPTSGETQKDFIERCMSVMVPETESTDQAVAMCMKQWRDGKSSSHQYQRFTAALDVGVRFVKSSPAVPDPKASTGEKSFVAGEATTKRTLFGYATTFNCLSEDRGGYCFTVVPGAFKSSIEKDDVTALFNHSADMILGRMSNGTLRLAEDAKGLKIEMDLPDTQLGQDMYALVARGDVKQMSFGGQIVREMEHADPALTVISIHEFKLWDVSPVVFPAFEQERTRIGVEAESAKVPPTFTLSKPRLYAAKRRAFDL